ncbi:hypothetical protein B0O99DRAFT_680732 [Bisporella sp. PMI_857]|nr:hypothetical protein B0O99DRAFT_680732 [Bisporella sp. PMI_857]
MQVEMKPIIAIRLPPVEGAKELNPEVKLQQLKPIGWLEKVQLADVYRYSPSAEDRFEYPEMSQPYYEQEAHPSFAQTQQNRYTPGAEIVTTDNDTLAKNPYMYVAVNLAKPTITTGVSKAAAELDNGFATTVANADDLFAKESDQITVSSVTTKDSFAISSPDPTTPEAASPAATSPELTPIKPANSVIEEDNETDIAPAAKMPEFITPDLSRGSEIGGHPAITIPELTPTKPIFKDVAAITTISTITTPKYTSAVPTGTENPSTTIIPATAQPMGSLSGFPVEDMAASTEHFANLLASGWSAATAAGMANKYGRPRAKTPTREVTTIIEDFPIIATSDAPEILQVERNDTSVTIIHEIPNVEVEGRNTSPIKVEAGDGQAQKCSLAEEGVDYTLSVEKAETILIATDSLNNTELEHLKPIAFYEKITEHVLEPQKVKEAEEADTVKHFEVHEKRQHIFAERIGRHLDLGVFKPKNSAVALRLKREEAFLEELVGAYEADAAMIEVQEEIIAVLKARL